MYSLGKKLDSKSIELFGRKNKTISNMMGKKVLYPKKSASKEYFKEEEEMKKSDLEKM